MRLRTWLFERFRQVATRYGFEEYDAPVLESEELYVRKAGEEIVDQLYTLTDKSGRRLALRAEMTPSLARLVLQKGSSVALPLKWFSIPQCWRYERMTRGRRREHYQWNMDIVGVAEVTAEAELLAALVAFFESVGLGAGDVVIKVSSRKILQTILERLGIAAAQLGPVCVLVDKLEKLPRETVAAELASLGLNAAQIDRLVAITAYRELDALAAALGDDQGGIRDLRELWQLAAAYGYADWLRFDASLVRGLAYYTGLVFEAFDRKTALRAICGGGRYDRLLSTFGGADRPACGFGFGDAVIVELLQERGLLPVLGPCVDDVVFALTPELRSHAIRVAQRLRAAGRSVDLVLEAKKAKWAYRHADAAGARRVVMLAPDEWAAGRVRVKELATGNEQDVPAEHL